MPRTARSTVAQVCYHVINRGNHRARVFDSPGDFRAFLDLVSMAQARVRLDLLAACLMPNHFHLVVVPHAPGDLGHWMHWLLTTHVCRYNRCRATTGRVWQGRFKAFPIERDEHLLTVMRYVERNALRAGLVDDSQDWAWGSLAWRNGSVHRYLLTEPPIELPRDWTDLVNSPQTSCELKALRTCVNRQRPFGNDAWVGRTAVDLGLQSSLRRVGRPPKEPRS